MSDDTLIIKKSLKNFIFKFLLAEWGYYPKAKKIVKQSVTIKIENKKIWFKIYLDAWN